MLEMQRQLGRGITQPILNLLSYFAAASYMHPLEFVLTDSIPKSVAPLLLGSHPVTLWLWHFLANLYTINSHSGYHLPFLPSNENHDYHHSRC